jgi:hypothetical protein
MWILAQAVSKCIEAEHKANSMSLVIQVCSPPDSVCLLQRAQRGLHGSEGANGKQECTLSTALHTALRTSSTQQEVSACAIATITNLGTGGHLSNRQVATVY